MRTDTQNAHISFPPGLNKAMLSDLVPSLEGEKKGEVIPASLSPQRDTQLSHRIPKRKTKLFVCYSSDYYRLLSICIISTLETFLYVHFNRAGHFPTGRNNPISQDTNA